VGGGCRVVGGGGREGRGGGAHRGVCIHLTGGLVGGSELRAWVVIEGKRE
jgi:hypothetical protein